MASVLDIIDTVVKIGLGALISGVSTYMLTTKKFDHELIKSKAESKKELIKEATLSYETGFTHINLFTNDLRKYGGENISEDNAKTIAEHLNNAESSINTAESLTRLSSLVELADCYGEYSQHLDALNVIFTRGNKIYFPQVNELIEKIRGVNEKINPLISRAFDDIYA